MIDFSLKNPQKNRNIFEDLRFLRSQIPPPQLSMALSPEHDKCGGYLNRQVLSFALGLIATKCSSPFSGYAGLTRNAVSCHFKFIRTTYHM